MLGFGLVLLRESRADWSDVGHRNPDWGLPDMDVLRQLAFGNGLRLERIVSHNLHVCVTISKMLPFTHFCLFAD